MTANTTKQIKPKEIREQKDLYTLQRGDVLLITHLHTSTFRPIGARVLKPLYNADTLSGNLPFIDLCYRESDNIIINGHVLLLKSYPTHEGALNAYFTSYGFGYRNLATDFNELDSFLREAGL